MAKFSREYPADGAVLAARIHALQHQRQLALTTGMQTVLQGVKLGRQRVQPRPLCCPSPRAKGRGLRVEIAQLEFALTRYPLNGSSDVAPCFAHCWISNVDLMQSAPMTTNHTAPHQRRHGRRESPVLTTSNQPPMIVRMLMTASTRLGSTFIALFKQAVAGAGRHAGMRTQYDSERCR